MPSGIFVLKGNTMSSSDLHERCLAFLKTHDFVALEWKYGMITAYANDGGPWEKSEFIKNSPTANAFEELEVICDERELADFTVSLDPPKSGV